MNRSNLQRRLRATRVIALASLAGRKRLARPRVSSQVSEQSPSSAISYFEALWASLGSAALTLLRSVTIGVATLFRDNAGLQLQGKIDRREIVGPITACLIVPIALLLFAPGNSLASMMKSGFIDWVAAAGVRLYAHGVKGVGGNILIVTFVGLFSVFAAKIVAFFWTPARSAVPWVAYVVLAAAMLWAGALLILLRIGFPSLFWVWFWLILVPCTPGAVSAASYLSKWTARTPINSRLRILWRRALYSELSLVIMAAYFILVVYAYRMTFVPKEFIGKKPRPVVSEYLVEPACYLRDGKAHCTFLMQVPEFSSSVLLVEAPKIGTVNSLCSDASSTQLYPPLGWRGGSTQCNTLESVTEVTLVGKTAPLILAGGDVISFDADLPVQLGPDCRFRRVVAIFLVTRSAERDLNGYYRKRDKNGSVHPAIVEGTCKDWRPPLEESFDFELPPGGFRPDWRFEPGYGLPPDWPRADVTTPVAD